MSTFFCVFFWYLQGWQHGKFLGPPFTFSLREAPSLTATGERIETWEDIPGIDGILRHAQELDPIKAIDTGVFFGDLQGFVFLVFVCIAIHSAKISHNNEDMWVWFFILLFGVLWHLQRYKKCLKETFFFRDLGSVWSAGISDWGDSPCDSNPPAQRRKFGECTKLIPQPIGQYQNTQIFEVEPSHLWSFF